MHLSDEVRYLRWFHLETQGSLQGRVTMSGLFPQKGPINGKALLRFRDLPGIQIHDKWIDKKRGRGKVEITAEIIHVD